MKFVRRGLRVFVAVLMTACNPAQSMLAVDLRTDLLPFEEFTQVEVCARPQRSRIETCSTHAAPRVGDAGPFSAGAYVAPGVRVTDIDPMSQGTHALTVRLLDDLGVPVLARSLLVTVQRPRTVVVVMTRSCVGVSCPAPDGNPAAVTCVGGQCAEPECSPDDLDACPAPECAIDRDCAPRADCASGVCGDGVCLFEDRGTCLPGFRCDPDWGCVTLRGTECPPGTSATSPADGLTSCTPCSAGTYSAEGAAACTPCPADTYAALVGSIVCEACPAREHSGPEASSCTSCSAGTYWDAATASCASCTADYYCTGNGVRNPCSDGYTSPAGSSAPSQCRAVCESGWAYHSGSGQCRRTYAISSGSAAGRPLARGYYGADYEGSPALGSCRLQSTNQARDWCRFRNVANDAVLVSSSTGTATVGSPYGVCYNRGSNCTAMWNSYCFYPSGSGTYAVLDIIVCGYAPASMP